MPTTHCDCGTSATLPFGVFQTNNNRFFGSVRISGQTKFLGNFASANDAAAAVRSSTVRTVPAQRVTYSGV